MVQNLGKLVSEEDSQGYTGLLLPYLAMKWGSLPSKMGELVSDSQEYLEFLEERTRLTLEDKSEIKEAVYNSLRILHEKEHLRCSLKLLRKERLSEVEDWENETVLKNYNAEAIDIEAYKKIRQKLDEEGLL